MIFSDLDTIVDALLIDFDQHTDADAALGRDSVTDPRDTDAVSRRRWRDPFTAEIE